LITIIKPSSTLFRDSNSFIIVAEKVREHLEKDRKVVVVVPPIRDTYEALREITNNPVGWEAKLRSIVERYYSIARGSISSEREFSILLNEFSRLFSELEKLVWVIRTIGEASEHIKALILSFGERFSAALMAAVLRSQGIESIWLDGREAGLIAYGNPLRAKIDTTKSAMLVKRKLLPLIEKNVVPVITGRTTGNIDGKVMLLSGDGDNYSAAIIAKLLKADELVFYTDKPLFLTTNLQSTRKTCIIPSISYAEAIEITLHSDLGISMKTLRTTAEAGTVVKVVSLEESSETVIGDQSTGPPIKYIGLIDGLLMVNDYATEVIRDVVYGIVSRIKDPLEEEKNVESIIVQSYGAYISIVAKPELVGKVGHGVNSAGVASVVIVGDGLKHGNGVKNLLSSIVEQYNVKGFVWFAGRPLIVVYAEPEEARELATRIHNDVVSAYEKSQEVKCTS
jgi:aspartate kinase